jgi:hypothetical protein
VKHVWTSIFLTIENWPSKFLCQHFKMVTTNKKGCTQVVGSRLLTKKMLKAFRFFSITNQGWWPWNMFDIFCLAQLKQNKIAPFTCLMLFVQDSFWRPWKWSMAFNKGCSCCVARLEKTWIKNDLMIFPCLWTLQKLDSLHFLLKQRLVWILSLRIVWSKQGTLTPL